MKQVKRKNNIQKEESLTISSDINKVEKERAKFIHALSFGFLSLGDTVQKIIGSRVIQHSYCEKIKKQQPEISLLVQWNTRYDGTPLFDSEVLANDLFKIDKELVISYFEKTMILPIKKSKLFSTDNSLVDNSLKSNIKLKSKINNLVSRNKQKNKSKLKTLFKRQKDKKNNKIVEKQESKQNEKTFNDSLKIDTETILRNKDNEDNQQSIQIEKNLFIYSKAQDDLQQNQKRLNKENQEFKIKNDTVIVETPIKVKSLLERLKLMNPKYQEIKDKYDQQLQIDTYQSKHFNQMLGVQDQNIEIQNNNDDDNEMQSDNTDQKEDSSLQQKQFYRNENQENGDFCRNEDQNYSAKDDETEILGQNIQQQIN